MNAKGYAGIPSELCHWITFLSKALPARSIGTFIELLIGAMLTPTGFVTDAYLMVNMRNHWTSYYKWLQHGKWSWLGLARQFARLVLACLRQHTVYLVIDDTLTLRATKKAPGSRIHHQHGNKTNLAAYVLGQCRVSLAMVAKRTNGEAVALPILSRLMPSTGNTSKLIAANALVRAIQGLLQGLKVYVLMDSWYMRRRVISANTRLGFPVIGQVRIDTRLYDLPLPRRHGELGRSRKYGEKYTPVRIDQLHRTITTLKIYGKEQRVRLRSQLVKARFLDGQLVHAVWCEFERSNGEWKAASLILSTDITLAAEQVIESYSLRWSIEPMFNQLKQTWGMKEAWQQTRKTLHRRVHITIVSYGLVQLLSCLNNPTVDALCQHTPWRKENPKTAGQIRRGLTLLFRHVAIRQWWDATCKKFRPPDWGKNEDYRHQQRNTT